MLATLLKGKALFDNDFEFYQAATIGGDTDLRGFRNQRFSGKQSFYQSTDLRWNLGKIDKGVAPLRYGVFGGFDYGRVWVPNEESDKWHQAYGGGIWINGVNLVTGKLSLFNSADGLRVSAGLGFGF
jgi:hemolysin activation/secretion protein